MPPSAPNPPRKPLRLWRWLGRLLLAGLVLLGVLILFHRPLIFWALNRFCPQAAKMAGVELRLHASGSLWSDLALDDVEAHVGGYNVKVKHLALRYDLAPAWHQDWFKIPRAIVLHEVNATIDLREPSHSSAAPAKPADRKALMETLRKVSLPDIDLQHVTVDVLLPDAAWSVNDFSLDLPSGKEGTLHIASLTHPAIEGMPVSDITARLSLSPTSLHVAALRFPPDLEVEHLDVDASQFDRDRLVLGAKVRSGKAVFAFDASTELREQPLVDLSADLTGLDQQSAGRWLNSAPEWSATVNKLHITAKGDVMNPRTLQAHVSVDASGLGYQQWKGDGLSTEINLASGLAEISPLAVTAKGNRFELTAKAQAPAKWEEFARAPVEVHWRLSAPEAQDLAGLPAKLSGELSGEGDASLGDQQLRSFAAKITGRQLALDQNRLRSLDLSAQGDLKAIAFDLKALADAGDGVLESHGKLGLEAGAPSAASWNIALPKPVALARSLNLGWPADVMTGELATEGAADFDLNQIKAGRYEGAKARGTLKAKDLAWRGAPCPLVTAAFTLDRNKATVSGLDIALPSNNKVHVTGEGEVSGERPFNASVTVDFTDLPALQPWLDAASKPQPAVADSDPSHTGAALLLGTPDGKELLAVKSPPAQVSPPPRLQGGTLYLAWHGNGLFKDGLKLQGNASLKADKVRSDKLPDALTLELAATHDLEKAVVQSLTTSLGPWAAKLKGTLGKTAVELTGIEASNSGRRLLSGSLQVPVDLNAKPLPVDPGREIHVNLATEGTLSLSALAGYGKATLPPDVSGLVSGNVAVNGSLPRLQSRIDIQATQLHLPNVPGKEPGAVSFLLTLKDGMLNLDSTAAVKPLNDLLIHASAKFDQDAAIKDPASVMNTPFDAAVKLHQPSLEFVKTLVPQLDEVRGSANIDLAAKGTFKTPRISGIIILDVPSVEPHDPNLPVVKNLKARVTGDGTALKLESLQAIAAGGELQATGACELKDMTKPEFNVTVKARDLLIIRNDNLSQRTDADLVCKGTPQAAALTGSVDLTRGRVFQEVNFLPINKVVNDLPPLPDAQARKAETAAKAEASTSPFPPALAAWTFDVNLRTKDSVRLLGNVLGGGVRSDIHLGGTGAKPEVTGQANLEDAIINLPFSTLRVKEGVVTFEKEKPLAPNLELTAESSVDIYDIVLHGYGSALDPKIHFTSTPPLSEGDIATLLATGSTASGLQKAGDDAAGRALLFLVRETYRRVFNSKAKPPKKGEKPSESRFIVQERSQDGALGGVTGTYEFNKKLKISGSTNKEGSFRAMVQYLFHFD